MLTTATARVMIAQRREARIRTRGRHLPSVDIVTRTEVVVMPSPKPTPISLVEEFFGERMSAASIKGLDRVSTTTWIQFATAYRDRMSERFVDAYIAPESGDAAQLRFYFEPQLREAWDNAVERNYTRTPLLGLNPYPEHGVQMTPSYASSLLGPLKKHLLFADSVYIRDSFYYCFDGVADLYDKEARSDDPNIRNMVEHSVEAIKDWLPILLSLRDLIESDALVFMPYYVTPSFPWGGRSPELAANWAKLAIPPRPGWQPRGTMPQIDFEHFFNPPPNTHSAAPDPDTQFLGDDTTAAWLNARLLDLAPVFPSKVLFDWASQIHFLEDAPATDVTSDLMSIRMLPFGEAKGLGVGDLHGMRRNERVFSEVRKVVLECARYIESELKPDVTQKAITAVCKGILRDGLAEYERTSVLKFLDEQPVASIVLSIAVGVAFVTAPPVLAIVVPALLTPKLGRIVQGRLDPTRRAYRHLESLL